MSFRPSISGMAAANKGESSYLYGGRGIVKEGVKVRGILSGFGCDLDVHDAVIDSKAHKNHSCGQAPVRLKTPGGIKRLYQGRIQLWRAHRPDGIPLSCVSVWDVEEAVGIAFRWHLPILEMLNTLNISTHNPQRSDREWLKGQPPLQNANILMGCDPHVSPYAFLRCWQ